ncbi:hypothetical protein [Microbacterium sp. SORGH_AS_0421]|uniref:hypothetical protein n=1 Tax=Microbacterium sp. SORGH_AS_0421 TaxID=3041768 RepID=UPI00278CC178|nr:hypothetical protein [Microbacterium sp. SORGH_AS_0421]MDQ1176418.1 hypothetical protein [Microbacterium sp. SORGH_AS_0421]
MTSRAALESALSNIDVHPGRAWRRSLSMGESTTLAQGESAIVYVRSGELTGLSAARAGCSVNAPSGAATAVEGGRTLLTGDAFISLGCHSLELASQSGAEVTVVPLEVVPTVHTRALPPVVFVSGFARAEPAAAGLAAHLGIPAPGAALDRQGDETICKLMVTTVLLSALRAWARVRARDLVAAAHRRPVPRPCRGRHRRRPRKGVDDRSARGPRRDVAVGVRRPFPGGVRHLTRLVCHGGADAPS